jgi:Aminoglycoside-2''-adenylyltransferase
VDPTVNEQRPERGAELSETEIEALAARWSSSWTPREVAARLAGIDTPWYIAGGWAADLFLGRTTRAHADIEIAVPAEKFNDVLSRFPGLVFDAVGSGRIWPDATAAELAAVHQTWLRDPDTGNYVLDVLREPHDGDTWICRRDGSIRLPYDEIIHRTQDGIPYLVPELVILFKAKHVRTKDEADVDLILPQLTPAQRRTLGDFLARVHPGHRWLESVSALPPGQC